MGRIVYAPSGTTRIVGVDTDQKISARAAADLGLAGVAFVLRYVSLGAPRPEDLDREELEGIHAAHMPVFAAQHAHEPGWEPSAELGAEDGAAAARNAALAGLDPGCALVWDAEGIGPIGAHGAALTMAYGNAWFEQVQQGPSHMNGYAATMYVGDEVPLTGDELYHHLSFRRYGRSASDVPNVAIRGYQFLQLWPFNVEIIAGLRVDLDVVQADRLGDRIPWCVAA